MSKRQIAQELECSFNASGETVINPEDLQRLHGFLSDPIYRTGFDRNFWIWEKHEEAVPYLLVPTLLEVTEQTSVLSHYED